MSHRFDDSEDFADWGAAPRPGGSASSSVWVADFSEAFGDEAPGVPSLSREAPREAPRDSLGDALGDASEDSPGDPLDDSLEDALADPLADTVPAYDSFDTDTASIATSAVSHSRPAPARPPRQPVITKSHQLSHIQSIFSDSQKIAYVGLCYLEIHSTKEKRLSLANNVAAQSYHAWADRFMLMLYAFLDVSPQEQDMIANLVTHGLVPADLSKSLLDDAERALERLEKLEQEQAWIAEQEAKYEESSPAFSDSANIPSTSSPTSLRRPSIPPPSSAETNPDVSDIRYTILSHLFILCICDGSYDTRSRSLLRAVARHLEIDWWTVSKLETTISDQLRKNDAESNENDEVKIVEESIITERNKKDGKGRWVAMGLATIAGGAIIGLTAGLAAPLIASGIASAMTTFHVAGGLGAGVATFMGGSTGIALIASGGASIGGGMTGYKMHRRTKGILEFEFVSLEEALLSIQANKEKRALQRRKRDKSAAAKDEKTALEAASDSTTDPSGSGSGSGPSGGGEGLPAYTSDSPLVVLASEVVDEPNPASPVSPMRQFNDSLEPGKHSRRGSYVSSIGSLAERVTSRELNREFVAPILYAAEPPPPEEGESGGPGSEAESGDASSPPIANPKANVLITIPGWVGSLDSRDDFTLPFSTLTPGVHGEQYALVWETQALVELGHAVRMLMAEITGFLVQQGIQYFLLPVLMAGLTGPLWALKLTYMVDNPWGNGLTKAKKAGRILADTLLSRVQGNRPVTLVGFSLGARVIYYCLLELSTRGPEAFSLVEEAYLFGTPVMATKKEWTAISSVVSGRLVNGYITNDYILSMLYRASSAFVSDVAGLNPVLGVEGVENYNLDAVLKGGHLEYRSAMPRVLKHVGFSVDDEFFDDGEKEAEQERIDLELAKERAKSDKERVKEEAAKKKQAEYEEKMRIRKEVEAVKRVEAEERRKVEVARKAQRELEAKNAPPRKSWWSRSTETVAAVGKEEVGELPFEIKEIKSTLPPLVVEFGEVKEIKGTLPPLVVSLDEVVEVAAKESPFGLDGGSASDWAFSVPPKIMDIPLVALVSTCSVGVLSLAWILSKKNARRTGSPPLAAHALPFIGHLLTLRKGPSVFIPMLFEGTDSPIVEVRIPGRNFKVFLARGQEAMRSILTNTQLNLRYVNPEGLKRLNMLETGILQNSHIPGWKHNRKLLVGGIGRPQFLRGLAAKINTHMYPVCGLLDHLDASKTPVLANMLFGSISLDVTVDLLFSQDHQAATNYLIGVDGTKHHQDQLLTHIQNWFDAILFYMFVPTFLFKHVPGFSSPAMKHHDNVVALETLLLQMIQERANQLETSVEDSVPTDLVSILSQDKESCPTWLDDALQIVKEAVAGGIDTSSNTMAFLTYELAKNPDVAEQVYQEIIEVVGRVDEFNTENIGRLRVLEAAIHETLRLHSIFSFTGRRLSQDVVVGDVVVQKGDIVWLALQENHVSPELWEDSLRFDPSRFLSSRELGGPLGQGFAYAPFGAGVRKCPGEALAMMEMKLIMANLIRRYKFVLMDPSAPLVVRDSLGLQCQDLPV
ncbi:hypothetical protein HDU98_010492, partial [Podochytrium sp. JEL0797]